jgi:hypothetical protein
MAWDPALLRKYSSTNHFKLLNQVRSDLKEQPIQRSSGQGGARRGSSRRRPAPAPQPVAYSSASSETSSSSQHEEQFVAVPLLLDTFE